MPRSIDSFDIRKFSKFVLVDTVLPPDVDPVVNSWYHYPYRSDLSVSFVQAEDELTIFVYWKGTCLEKVHISANTYHLCSFMTRFPSIGFKQISLTGSLLKRFQVSLNDRKVFDEFAASLRSRQFAVTEVSQKKKSSMPYTLSENTSLDHSFNSVSDLSLFSQNWPQDSQKVEDSQFFPSQYSVAASFGTQLVGPILDSQFTSTQNWEMPFQCNETKLVLEEEEKPVACTQEKRRAGISKAKPKKLNLNTLADKELKAYVLEQLQDEDFYELVHKLDKVITQNDLDEFYCA